ncbi:MAG TPA: SHOCT domain-containing protein [Terriglobales bacterium]|nr:SHOCT domain-containing protein [Terriglobales bacterium]
MAAVGGVAYAAGRGGANRAAQEQMQDQQIGELQAQQAAAQQPVATQPPAAPPEMTSDDRLRQLRELGELKSSGVLTDEEFQREKARLLVPR